MRLVDGLPVVPVMWISSAEPSGAPTVSDECGIRSRRPASPASPAAATSAASDVVSHRRGVKAWRGDLREPHT